MKKIKKVSVRISQKMFNKLIKDYLHHKNNPTLVKYVYNDEVNTFSDYIRLKLS